MKWNGYNGTKKGNVVLAGAGDGTAWLWLATTGVCMQVFAGHEGAVRCGGFSGNGKMVITGSVDGTVRLWNPKSGACTAVFGSDGDGKKRGGDMEQAVPVNTICIHPSKPLLLSAYEDGTARLIQLQSKKLLGVLSHAVVKDASSTTLEVEGDQPATSVEALGFHIAGDGGELHWAATGGLDGRLCIWDLDTMKRRTTCVHTGAGGAGGVTKLVWHSSAPLVLWKSPPLQLVEGWSEQTMKQVNQNNTKPT